MMNTLINKEGFYIGPSMMWGVEDVEIYAESRGVTLSEQDLKTVLCAALEDNESLMAFIQECIQDELDYHLEEKIIKPIK